MEKPSIDIQYVADLARISLNEEEKKMFGEQFASILGYIEKLKEVKIDDVVLKGEEEGFKNNLREDLPQDGLATEDVLRNAPHHANNLFIVPKIIE
ncbi:glutamyl-tRNA amidotransferase [Methylacidiphilum sp. Yel]|jgi:aspartyl-tRNA(Asn)/glutamyl-tRNA(Gln) amidotransferase subunit C|uniref:Asp-tRNA(Asn)/Glu-tRNA(Gln) amidotransferase subunit GatC n=1 Tax=Methylacidiphilum sp. Yel TaxID=1847730 RepID=UPI00106BD181|nr:Asp-tRNA(Asn)/Glu-tRNA(Gln) amidotransferase subunit GatC [Methylacidiphilum sp. Yel]TFE68059.1 glutamyl-tRNA amidotransferase [Methylacidiphilum sp. Yel]